MLETVIFVNLALSFLFGAILFNRKYDLSKVYGVESKSLGIAFLLLMAFTLNMMPLVSAADSDGDGADYVFSNYLNSSQLEMQSVITDDENYEDRFSSCLVYTIEESGRQVPLECSFYEIYYDENLDIHLLWMKRETNYDFYEGEIFFDWWPEEEDN